VRSEQAEYGDEPPLDPLLGQPRMVSDPRISVAQAAQILGKTRAQVYRLVHARTATERGEPNKFRGCCCPTSFSAATVET
jgi:hypothetical protein